MLCKRIEDRFVISRDGRAELFGFGCGEFASIAYASASRDGDSILITAARLDSDRASVEDNRKGNYRAFRINGDGITQLTQEYTSTAIALPGGRGIA